MSQYKKRPSTVGFSEGTTSSFGVGYSACVDYGMFCSDFRIYSSKDFLSKQEASFTNFDSLNGFLFKKYAPKKEQSLVLADVYEHLDDVLRAGRVRECGSALQFLLPLERPDLHSRLVRSNFCKDRLCPMCQWRRSIKTFSELSKVVDFLDLTGKYVYLFLTLTCRNCSYLDFEKTMDMMNAGWRELSNNVFRHRLKGIVLGTFRTFEVTVNRASGTLHPHIHAILAVPKDYFTSSLYVQQLEWVELWQRACGLDYAPSVRIEKVKPDKDGMMYKSLKEVSKYIAKGSDIFSGDVSDDAEIVQTLCVGLYNRRLCSYTGVFRDVRRQLNLNDEDDDLLDPDEVLNPGVTWLLVNAQWKSGAYKVYFSSLDG